MKSSKDIQPRVGMQIQHRDGRRGLVTAVNGVSNFDGTNGLGSGGFAWEMGAYEIEWTPPTDEERKMFADHAKRIGGGVEVISRGWNDCHDDCHEKGWNVRNTGTFDYKHMAEIAESLALDGAGDDNMPEGFE